MPVVPGRNGLAHFPVLTTLGFDDRWAALTAEAGQAPLRVVRDDRGAVVAIGEAGEVRLATPPGLQPVTGDWIVATDDRVVAIAERSSAVVRPRPDGGVQVLAANVDLVAVMHGLDGPLNRRRLERGVVLGWESGAQPVVILTKADLAADADAAVREASASAPGVDVVLASVVDGRGLDQVRALLQPNRTMTLIGASGAGKSSLVNALLGTDVMQTQDVRAVDGKGRHTTTHRELVPVPGGGLLLDTPGLRALTVGAASEGLDLAFPEIEELAESCHFRDCRHDSEPGCAVAEALRSATLDPDRFEGWRRVRREVESAQLRADPVALRQRSRQWGRMGREAMQLKRGEDPHRRRS